MNKLSTAFLSLPLIFGACASPEKNYVAKTEREQVSIESKQVAAQVGTPYVTEMKFKKGASSLFPAATKKIKTALDDAAKNVKIESVTIVAWSDSELPSDEQKELDDASVELAAKRGETLKKFVESIVPKVSAEVVNMAKRPGKLKKFLKTQDARVLAAFESVGVAHADSPNKTAESKASSGVLIIVGSSK